MSRESWIGVILIIVILGLFSHFAGPSAIDMKACAESCQITGRQMDKVDRQGCFCAEKKP